MGDCTQNIKEIALSYHVSLYYLEEVRKLVHLVYVIWQSNAELKHYIGDYGQWP